MKNKKSKDLQINAEVSSAPRKVFSNYAQISEKDKSVQRFSNRCRMLLNEVQERSATLQQYASDLVSMDKDLREAQNNFDEEYEATKIEMEEQEEEYMHMLATLREQKEQLSNALSAATKSTSALVSRISKFAEEKNSLESKETGFEQDIQKVPQIALEKMDFEIDQERKRISELDIEIAELNQAVTNVTTKSQSLIQEYNTIMQKQKTVKQVINDESKSKENDSNLFKSNITSSTASFQTLSANEIKLLGMQSVAKKKIQNLNEKIENIDKMHQDVIEKLKPFQANLLVFQQKLQTIKDEENQFHEAINKRTEFDRGIKASIQRAQLRSNEIYNQLQIIRDRKKKVTVDQFMEEENIEKLTTEEKKALVKIGEIEEEINEFNSEESKVDKQMKSISNQYETYQNETISFQKNVLSMQRVYKDLKEKINSFKKEQKGLVKTFKELKNSNYDLSGPEIDKEKKQVESILKGYRTQISYSKDQIQNLNKIIKTEELKSAIGSSELRRLNANYKENTKFLSNSSFSSVSSIYETNQDERKKKIGVLKYAIEDLEKRKSELQTKITYMQVSIAEKTKEITKSQNEIDKSRKEIKESKLNELQENLEPRISLAKSLCQSVTSVIIEINKSIDNWKKENFNSIKEVSELKQWNKVISSFHDKAEDLEIQTQVLT